MSKRPRRRFTNRGRTHTIAEWSRIKGIPYSTLRARLDRGLSIERALKKPERARPAPGRSVLPDVVGRVFGDLTVMAKAPNRNGSVKRVLCRCACGTELEVDVIRLVREGQEGCSQSKECLRKRGQRQWRKRDSVVAGAKAAGVHAEYVAWVRLKASAKRGDAVSPLWLSDFWEFLEEVGTKPEPNYWLARFDKEGPWDLDNACWMHPKEAIKYRR